MTNDTDISSVRWLLTARGGCVNLVYVPWQGLGSCWSSLSSSWWPPRGRAPPWSRWRGRGSCRSGPCTRPPRPTSGQSRRHSAGGKEYDYNEYFCFYNTICIRIQNAGSGIHGYIMWRQAQWEAKFNLPRSSIMKWHIFWYSWIMGVQLELFRALQTFTKSIIQETHTFE